MAEDIDEIARAVISMSLVISGNEGEVGEVRDGCGSKGLGGVFTRDGMGKMFATPFPMVLEGSGKMLGVLSSAVRDGKGKTGVVLVVEIFARDGSTTTLLLAGKVSVVAAAAFVSTSEPDGMIVDSDEFDGAATLAFFRAALVNGTLALGCSLTWR